ncbi:MAG TPA: GlyGly-CTERM sorting domain-containing protein [Acidimicrobiia bacterium]|nr:GlyGly-CTERM sorting domain-containing protein [Acidimicrobiia bacterium]
MYSLAEDLSVTPEMGIAVLGQLAFLMLLLLGACVVYRRQERP